MDSAIHPLAGSSSSHLFDSLEQIPGNLQLVFMTSVAVSSPVVRQLPALETGFLFHAVREIHSAEQGAILGSHYITLQFLGRQCKTICNTQEKNLASLQEIHAGLPPTQNIYYIPGSRVTVRASYCSAHSCFLTLYVRSLMTTPNFHIW